MGIIKTNEQFDSLRESGRILGIGVKAALDAVEPGITTNELDAIFMNAIKEYNAEPSFLGYQGFPKSICTSVNNAVVHGIPSDQKLKEGDIIGVDCGVRFENMCTDMARTVAVGEISEKAKKLMNITEQSLRVGIKQAVAGNTTGDIGAAVEEFVEPHGYGVVRSLAGHGLGEAVHEEPSIPNYGEWGKGTTLEVGMAIAIEPMLNLGTHQVQILDDGWTVVSADDSLTAHFEDTLLITEEGPEVVTILPS